MVWERELSWLPTFSCPIGDVALRGTIFAPYGEDSDFAGAVIALSLENRGAVPATISCGVDGVLGYRHQRIRSPRPFEDRHSARLLDGAVVIGGRGLPDYCAMAIAADADDAVYAANESS